MARTPSKSPARRSSKAAAAGKRKGLFTSYAVHSADAKDKKILGALKKERKSFRGFTVSGLSPAAMDAESAAKRILMQSLESEKLPKLAAPKVGAAVSEFKSLGVETVALTGTRVVKFRQTIDNIPVYGSLVSVELDDKNECVSINSNVASPKVASHAAKVSPLAALKTAAKAAGYGKDLPCVTPELNFYADSKGTWHLAYIFPNVKTAPGTGRPKAGSQHLNFRMDYIVDALDGKLVAAIPRTTGLTASTVTAADELGVNRRIGVAINGSRQTMTDLVLNIETHDFAFQDTFRHPERLPGKLVSAPPPFPSAAVSAHANAADVARFMRDVLMRNNIDNKGGKLVSVINTIDSRDSPDGKQWFNAFWDGVEMVYGQVKFNGGLRSIAASADVVAHEFFHGVTDHTAQLVYELESGAMNESYSDIFGTIISNFAEPDVGQWNWLVGDAISSAVEAFRSTKDPAKFGQPKHMKDFVVLPNTEHGDFGGVHTNSGIHNYAAYRLMTAKSGGKYLFKPEEAAAIFYITVTQQLSRQSGFSDSRRGAVVATRSLFRTLAVTALNKRVRAVERAFKSAGIL